MDYGLSFAVNIMERSFVLCQNKPQHLVSAPPPPPWCIFVSRLWEISALWVSRPPERGGLFCMIERERVAWCYKVSKKLCLIVLSPSLLCIQGFMPFASFCNLSIVSASVLQFCEVCRICFIVRPALSEYCLKQYAACSNRYLNRNWRSSNL